MNRTEFIEEVHARLPIYFRNKIAKRAVRRILLTAFDVIMETTAIGEEVRIRGFATIGTYKMKGHRVYCGLTGEYTSTREHMRIRLAASQEWKDKLQRTMEGSNG